MFSDGSRRLVTVIGHDELEQSAVHAAGVIDPVESKVDPELHLAAISLAAPDKFADMPNRISRSVTPRTAGTDRDRCGLAP